MRIRAYDECERKLQTYWYDTNLETCGRVVGDEAGSGWCAKEFVLCCRGREAGKRHQSYILQDLSYGSCVEGSG